MKKALIFSAVLTISFAMLQSCAPNRKMPRPQRNPTPPKKFVMHKAPVQQAAVVEVKA